MVKNFHDQKFFGESHPISMCFTSNVPHDSVFFHAKFSRKMHLLAKTT